MNLRRYLLRGVALLVVSVAVTTVTSLTTVLIVTGINVALVAAIWLAIKVSVPATNR